MIKVSFEDLKAIEKTMETYTQGTLIAGEKGVATMKKSFHEDAICWGWYKDGSMGSGHVQGLYDVLLPASPVSDHKIRMDILDVSDTVAAVKVDLEKIWPNESKHFVDYHELIKIDGEWKIIAKAFAQHKDTPMELANFEDIAAIERTMNTYLLGTLNAGESGVTTMKQAMHDDAICWGWYNTGIMGKGHVQGLYDVLLPAAPVSDHKVRMDILDISDTIAFIKVDLIKIWPNDRKHFVDYHELMKIDGRWQIIAKVFSQYK